MSDIFISYKREEQEKARQLAATLEKQGWSVWWDPKLRAGEYFDEEIEKALDEARCVIVLWSSSSVQSRYVKDEATYALDLGKLIPVTIEEVNLPLRFRGIQTLQLIDWDGNESSEDYKNLLDDITALIGPPLLYGQEGYKHQSEVPQSSHEFSIETEKPELEIILPELVLIEGGEFVMGSDPVEDCDAHNDECPQHKVCINPFYLGKYEVTFAEYIVFTNVANRNLPDDRGWGREHRPVINVKWEDAVDYAVWLSQQTGKRYRLPTEAEWEYAARAGGTTIYGWGDEICQDNKVWANCDGCGNQGDSAQTAPVGSFEPNAFGLYDMAGNVAEWTQDCWHDNYQNAPSDGSAWLESNDGNCTRRVIRGGSFSSKPRVLRSAHRNGYITNPPYGTVGFRLAQDP